MDPNSSSVGQPLLYPKSVIPSKFSNRTIVTDVLISRGTTLGPYPGNDAIEKKCNNWMQYVTSVTDYQEANLLVAFSKNQLYFHCNRTVRAGTELIVWGGQKKIHLLDPSEWTTYKMNDTGLTFLCQECDLNFKTPNMLTLHNNSGHQAPKFSVKDCKCPHCPFIGYSWDFLKHVVRHGIDLYGKPFAINQNKVSTEIENSKSKPDSESTKTSTARNEENTKNKVYNCKLCKKTFERLRQLCGHIGAMHKPKFRYGKIASKRKLNSHGRVGNTSQHSTGTNEILEKRNRIKYECNYCEKLFQTRPLRNQHVRTAHLRRQFVCSVCKKVFTLQSNLKRHVRNLHNSEGYVITMKDGITVS